MRWRFNFAVTMIIAFAGSATGYAATVADSSDDWSVDGTQGEKGWFNGYYNLTADDDQKFSTKEFIPFTNDGSGDPTDPEGNHWNGTQWDLTPAASGPWSELGQMSAHPNGTNSVPGEEQWVIRRWVSTYAGDASLISELTHTNVNCGNGTSAELYVNGNLFTKITNIANTPVTQTAGAVLKKGDILDLALTPEGNDGTRGDGCDGSTFRLTVTDQKAPPPPPPPTPALADSLRDWSAEGKQGEKGWFGGFYNLTADDDQTYSVKEFTPFTNDGSGPPTDPEGNHWNGTQWDLTGAASGPWTELGPQNTHPNGTNSAPNEEQWTIRRWQATGIAGATTLDLNWQMAKGNLNGGGVGGILFLNGQKIDEAVIAGNDGKGVDRTIAALVKPGDFIDLALTPENLDGTRGDGADGSRNRLVVRVKSLAGDFDGDGQLAAADIDALTKVVIAGSNEARYDVNADSLVNQADRDVWVNTLKKTYYGDANLDGQFTSGDFVQVFQLGEYEDKFAKNSTWASGDWNGDLEFGTADFVTAFQAGGFEAGPRAAVSAVPEPSSLVLLSGGLLLLARRRRS